MPEEMTAIERLGATTDILGTYQRGIRVGHARAVEQVINWMVTHNYPVGELDGLLVQLSELQRMAFEEGQAESAAALKTSEDIITEARALLEIDSADCAYSENIVCDWIEKSEEFIRHLKSGKPGVVVR